MRTISIKFVCGCPHCNQVQKVEVLSNGEIEGAALEVCTNPQCRRQFAIAWSFEVEADVYKCDIEAADVECNFTLSEGWDPDDPDEDR